MGNLKRSFYPTFLLILILFTSYSCQKNEIKLHYLGHSAVFIDFNNEVTVLSDYGKENAYIEWGWDSPIYDAGDPGPDIISYSHHHDDHFDEKRAEKYKAIRIDGSVDTLIGKLSITSFESSEKDISLYDNYSYLFSINDIKVLHLGDCQADIMMINDPAHAWNLEHRYPKNCDILIMPIESTRKFILQAVKMVQLLEPRVLLPTHYWSEAYKQDFMSEMQRSYNKNGKNIQIISKEDPTFTYRKNDRSHGLLLLELKPAARKKDK
ncbi:MAG: MBL fold metallo-hydrolase [Candidatus Marinimicrobia bacterium]|nr:MBL fold metallo-hydrolase [Candidatus Neomarinimicrobiota bacterium]